MRPIAQDLSVALQQPVIVDNRPGAGNIIGTQAGARAAPDGYTLTMTGTCPPAWWRSPWCRSPR